MEQVLYQNSPGANDWMRKVGCFWRCGIRIPEIVEHGNITDIEVLNALWDKSLKKDLMSDTPTGPMMFKGVAPISNLGFKYCGSEKRVIEIGTMKDGEERLYGWAMERKNQNRFYIMKGILPETHSEPYHYKLVNKDLSIVFDPYLGGLETIGEEYTIILEVI